MKKNIQDDDEIYKSQYDYECRCQRAKAGGSATVDEAAQAQPDLSSAFAMPEGFALDEAWSIYDASALTAMGVAQQIVDQMAPSFLVGYQSTVSRCPDGGPCDEVRITTVAHTDAAAASAKTEAVFYGLPATAANMTGSYVLEGVGQSQFTATYPINDESGPIEAIHIGFHLEELSGEVMWTGSSPTIDEAKSIADEVIIALSKVYDLAPVPDASGLTLRFQGEAFNLVVPLVQNEITIPLVGRLPDEQAIYDMEFAQVLNGIRWRHEVPGVEGAPALIVINTVLQMPDLETAQSYLGRWPGLFQEVLDLQGILGEVVDPPVLLGDEGYHSAYAFTLDTGDGTVVDGLNLAGLFQGPASTWFASVSLRSSAPRALDPDVSTLVEEYQARLGGIAGSGFIPAYDSILRWTLNSGTEYLPVLLPPVPMPNISALLPQVDELPREPCLEANSCPDAAPCCAEVCCRTGEACIDGECCVAASVCGAFCCPPDETCGGGSCCPPTALCGGVCCEFESVCAADRCCLLDDLCVSSDGASRTCCTEEDGTCVDGACVVGTTG